MFGFKKRDKKREALVKASNAINRTTLPKSPVVRSSDSYMVQTHHSTLHSFVPFDADDSKSSFSSGSSLSDSSSSSPDSSSSGSVD